MTYEELFETLKIGDEITVLNLTGEDLEAISDFSPEYNQEILDIRSDKYGRYVGRDTSSDTLRPIISVRLHLNWCLTSDAGPVRQSRRAMLVLNMYPSTVSSFCLWLGAPESILTKFPMLRDLILHKDYVCLGLRQIAKDLTKDDTYPELKAAPHETVDDYFPAAEARTRLEAFYAGIKGLMDW